MGSGSARASTYSTTASRTPPETRSRHVPDTAASTVPISHGVVRLAELPLHHGGRVAPCEVAFALAGNPQSPTVVAFGGISAGRDVVATEGGTPGWWHAMAGPGRPLDTDRFAVLGIDWLGGRGASSRLAPEQVLDTRDQAHAAAAVLDHLGVARVHAVTGASYGGMVALAFAACFPERLQRVVVTGAAHRSHPMATAVRAVQRKIVRLGLDTGRAHDAMAIARQLAMTTYRTQTEFAERFAGGPETVDGRLRFPVEGYLEHHGRRFADAFDPQGFLHLSESLDLHRVDPADLTVETTLIAILEDTLVPPWQMDELARRTSGTARVVELHSPYGHDAFLKPDADLLLAMRAALAR